MAKMLRKSSSTTRTFIPVEAVACRAQGVALGRAWPVGARDVGEASRAAAARACRGAGRRPGRAAGGR